MNSKNRFIKKIIIFCMVAMFIAQNTYIHVAYSSSSRSITIYETTGTVTVRKTGGEQQTAAFVGMRLNKGDIINTGAESSATLDLDGNKVIVIAEETEAAISDESGEAGTDDSTVISLAKGSFFVSIKEKLAESAEFNVVTSNAVLAVRGTAFAMAILPSLKANATNELIVYSFTGIVSVNVVQLDPSGTLVDSGACELLPNTMLNTETVKPGESIVLEEINLDRISFTIAESILTIENINPDLLSKVETRIEEIKVENPEKIQAISEAAKVSAKEGEQSSDSTPTSSTSGQALVIKSSFYCQLPHTDRLPVWRQNRQK